MTTFKEHSKTSWFKKENSDQYPGDTNLIIGCLQRIADSSELQAKDHLQLSNSLDYYKKKHREHLDKIESLNNRIRSYKGQNTKLRNKLKSK